MLRFERRTATALALAGFAAFNPDAAHAKERTFASDIVFTDAKTINFSVPFEREPAYEPDRYYRGRDEEMPLYVNMMDYAESQGYGTRFPSLMELTVIQATRRDEEDDDSWLRRERYSEEEGIRFSGSVTRKRIRARMTIPLPLSDTIH